MTAARSSRSPGNLLDQPAGALMNPVEAKTSLPTGGTATQR